MAKYKANDAEKSANSNFLGGVRSRMPIAAAICVLIAIGFHTFRGGSPSGSVGNAPLAKGETQDEANRKRDLINGRAKQAAKDIEAGRPPTRLVLPTPATDTEPATTAATPTTAPIPQPPAPAPVVAIVATPAPAIPPAETNPAAVAAPVVAQLAPAPILLAAAPSPDAMPLSVGKPAVKPRQSATRPIKPKVVAAARDDATAVDNMSWMRQSAPDQVVDDLYRSAREALARHDFANAIGDLRTVIDRNPSHGAARMLLAFALSAKGNDDEAAAILESTHAVMPNEPGMVAILASLKARRINAPAERTGAPF